MIFTQNISTKTGWRIIKEFTLSVSYVDKSGKKVNYITPVIGFNPIKDLASRNCYIYIYNDEVYVSDFDVNYDNNYSLWSNETEEVKNMQEKNKNFKEDYFYTYTLPSIIIFIILIIISLVIGIICNI